MIQAQHTRKPTMPRTPATGPAEPSREFDVVVFGATGFTGRLVAEYLLAQYGVGSSLRWALAGRSLARLEALREQLGAPSSLPLLASDATDDAALATLAAKTRVIITTVGPYQLHGEGLLVACVAAGTDYVDLCGEPVWMALMIRRHQRAAQASGARIVFSCGFDSVPFDMGVLFLQAEAHRRWGQAMPSVHGLVRVMKGGVSGGTVASLLATLEGTSGDPAQARTLADPFALTPGFQGPAQAESPQAEWDPLAKAWTAPFVMATINTKNVHRSNALRGHAYGRDFIYSERVLSGGGAAGRLRAVLAAGTTGVQNRVLGFAPTRALVGRWAVPQPGQGPGPRARENGRYEVLFIGQAKDGRSLRAVVRGDRDQGYGSTSKMISECALCLLRDINRATTPGGLWTPAAAMGGALIDRLQAHAGLTFQIDA